MKLNERSVVQFATCGVPPDRSGFLLKKSERSGTFHRRWCVLKANLLFFFEERSRREPLGLVLLEGCTVELCESERVDFAFAVRFSHGHAHTLAAESQQDMEEWAKALARASFQYLRLVVRELERQLEEVQSRPLREGGGIRGSHSSPLLHTDDRTVTWNSPRGEEKPQEKSPEPTGSPSARENGVTWIKPCTPTNGVAWEEECAGRWQAQRPPPVPPRRRSPPDLSVSEVSPGTTCFSKLHHWYGRDVAQLRSEWLQGQ